MQPTIKYSCRSILRSSFPASSSSISTSSSSAPITAPSSVMIACRHYYSLRNPRLAISPWTKARSVHTQMKKIMMQQSSSRSDVARQLHARNTFPGINIFVPSMQCRMYSTSNTWMDKKSRAVGESEINVKSEIIRDGTTKPSKSDNDGNKDIQENGATSAHTTTNIIPDEKTIGVVNNDTSNNNCSSNNSGKSDSNTNTTMTTTPLDQRAATAILSQLSSPPNLLTLSRIIATPYLSYMLISHHHNNIIMTSSSVGAASSAGGMGTLTSTVSAINTSDDQGATAIDATTINATTQSSVTDATITTTTNAISTPSASDPASITTTIMDATNTAAADTLTTINYNITDPSSTPIYALSLFLVMGLTDYLDGYIARTYPSTATVLGTYLDPFADKIFINVMSLTLWYTGTLPGMLVGLWMVRDVGLVGTAYWMVKMETAKNQRFHQQKQQLKEKEGGDDGTSANNNDGSSNNNSSDFDGNANFAVMDPQKTPLKVQANFMSKVNTTLQIGLIALGIGGEVPFVNVPPELMTGLCWVTAGTTITSSLGYLDGSALKQSGNKSN